MIAPRLDGALGDGNKRYQKISIGKMPMMLKSEYCWLKNETEKKLTELGECVYDQGGYFIINSGEKVLIALERMADNFVYIALYSMKYSHSFFSGFQDK